MSFKQWSAILELVIDALVAAWVLVEAPSLIESGPAVVAAALLWAGLALVLINIAAAIGSAVVAGIVTRRAFRDEQADERDRSIYARGMRNAYFVSCLAGLMALFAMALGYGPALAAYALFFGGLAAGATGAGSRLYLYRIG